MIVHHKMLKEHEFNWLLVIRSKKIEAFLENRLVFLSPIQLNSPDGERILKFLRNQISGLFYCEFKVTQPASISTNLTTQPEIKFYDKIYFENPEDRQKFEVNFSGLGMGGNVVSIFDI